MMRLDKQMKNTDPHLLAQFEVLGPHRRDQLLDCPQ
jgi:hypothetical protein